MSDDPLGARGGSPTVTDGIIEARWTDMSVADAVVTDDAEYITRELADPRDENRTLDDFADD